MRFDKPVVQHHQLLQLVQALDDDASGFVNRPLRRRVLVDRAVDVL